MNNKIKIIGFALLAVLALGALGAGVAFAQTPTPNNPFGPGWMMGGFAQNGNSWEWMNSMHQWMTNSGGMHTFVWEALAETLGLTSDELYAELNSGKTIAQIAEENGVSRDDLIDALEAAHEDSLAQAVTDGYLTQEQADTILAQMAGRYEWMIDNAGAGYGTRGGRGGMMGRNWQQGNNGQFGPGGCHGNWYGNSTNPPNTP